MKRFDSNRIVIPGLLALSIVLMGVAAGAIYDDHRTWTLRIAAGARNGESFVLAQALKRVSERRHPSLRIVVKETEGTAENLALLDRHEADVATAQADVPAGSSAKAVADLYGDVFQLLVRNDAGIARFAQLPGKRIALPAGSGQFQSFLIVAEHFGFSPGQFTFVDTEDAEAALRDGRAEAIFWVRALGNPTATRLARDGGIRPLAIEQAAAMRIRNPAFEPAIIPQGAYTGNPPIPMNNLPTVLVRRTLLAHEDAPRRPVAWLTRTLMEHRNEIAREIPASYAELRPLLKDFRRPANYEAGGAGIHPGALEFYEQDKPAYVVENADFVALILSCVVLAGTWIWEFKRWIDHKQKNRADVYNRKFLELLQAGQSAANPAALAEMRQKLLTAFTDAVRELDEDKISEESFQSVRSVWQVAMDALREHRADLEATAKSHKR